MHKPKWRGAYRHDLAVSHGGESNVRGEGRNIMFWSENRSMQTSGVIDAKPRAFQEKTPLISAQTHLAENAKDSAGMVQVYVCDYDGIAQLVEVPVGTTLSELVTKAFNDPKFKKGGFRGFEDDYLLQHQLVTAADAGKWTAENPLRLKYKRDDSCLIL